MGPRELYATIGSTQDRAIELAREGAPEGTRVVARAQTHGRGRLDHRWWSPPGHGLYLSLILDAPPPPRTLLALAIGAELALTLEQRCGIRPVLKWPNDLLLVGSGAPRKISGILIDEVDAPDHGRREVVGIGVNVRSPPSELPEDLRGRIAAIEDSVHPPPSLDDVEEWVVAAALAASHRLSDAGGVGEVIDRCGRMLYGLGRSARVDGVPLGAIDGIGPEGELWLRQGPDRIAIRAGDVEVETAP